MHFAILFIAVIAFFGVNSHVYAAPLGKRSLESRQLGNLQCNIARLRIVSALGRTNRGTETLQGLTAAYVSRSDKARGRTLRYSNVHRDDTAQTAVEDALAGLQDAASGIRTIAGSIISGELAPADARDQVASGLGAAKTAFNSITSYVLYLWHGIGKLTTVTAEPMKQSLHSLRPFRRAWTLRSPLVGTLWRNANEWMEGSVGLIDCM